MVAASRGRNVAPSIWAFRRSQDVELERLWKRRDIYKPTSDPGRSAPVKCQIAHERFVFLYVTRPESLLLCQFCPFLCFLFSFFIRFLLLF